MEKYKVNFINASYIRFFKEHEKEIMGVIRRCLSNGDLILREDVRKFERNLARYVGTKYCVGVASGTDALFLSLKALDIGPGHEVITVGNCFIAPIQAIVHTGATPVLVDVGRDGLMNPEQLGRVITSKTRAIIPVHLGGKVCNMFNIMRIAYESEILVIEDTAQALGATWDGRKAGSFGATGCFSFNTPKTLGAYGDAGAITTNSKWIFKKLLLLRNHWNITQGSVSKIEYPQPKTMGWGWKSRLDNVWAACLNVKLKYYPQILSRRAEIARMYNEGLAGLPITLPIQYEGQIYQEYIIRYPKIQKLAQFMQKHGVEVLIRDTIPNHKLKGLKEINKFKLPITEEMAKDSARLPIYPELYDREVKYVIKVINDYFDQ